jgi:AcrR family transcriptional regulator
VTLFVINETVTYRIEMTVSTHLEPPSRGRPRSAASQEAILEAAFGILVERGFGAMSIEAVAARAGVGKTTVYRWWPSRADLAVDAFFAATQAELALPDTGSAEQDFRSQITALADLLRGPRGVALAAMLGGGLSDPGLAASLNSRWIEPRRRWGFERLSRAVADGDCLPDTDVPAALGIFYGPLYAPLLFGRGIPSTDQVKSHLDVACRAIFPS